MKKQFLLASFFFAFLIGCANESNKTKMQSVFDTKAEAEKAAKDFNCSGAHKMKDKWMPCDSHEAHEKHNKNDGSGHHLNH